MDSTDVGQRMRAVGRRVRALRKRHAKGSLSQEQLATLAGAGVERGWISMLEIGAIKDDPGAFKLDALARALNVDVHYLLTGEQPEGGWPVHVDDPAKVGYFERWKQFASDRLNAMDVMVGAWTSEPSAGNQLIQQGEQPSPHQDANQPSGGDEPPNPPPPRPQGRRPR